MWGLTWNGGTDPRGSALRLWPGVPALLCSLGAAEFLALHIAPSKPTHPPSGAGLVSPRPTVLRQARRFSIGGNVVPTLHVSGSQCHDWASFSLPNCERVKAFLLCSGSDRRHSTGWMAPLGSLRSYLM